MEPKEFTIEDYKKEIVSHQAEIDRLEAERGAMREELKKRSPHQPGDRVNVYYQNALYQPSPAYVKEVFVNLDGNYSYTFYRMRIDGSQAKSQLHVTRISHLTPYTDAK